MHALDQPATLPPPIRRRRRIWLRLALGLLAVMAACYGVLVYRAHWELSAVMAELDRRDPGWRLEEIEAAREVIPPQQNSAGPLLAARALLPAQWPTTPELYELLEDLVPEARLDE